MLRVTPHLSGPAAQAYAEDTSVSCSESTYHLLAQVIRAKGLHGATRVRAIGDPAQLYPHRQVWIVPPLLKGVRQTQISASGKPNDVGELVLSLDGVNDRAAACELAGRYLLAATEQCVIHGEGQRNVMVERPIPLFESARAQAAGCHFWDVEQGELGRLEQTESGSHYDCWIIDGPWGKLRVPAVKDYLVDSEPGLVTLRLPDGFLAI
ncbi:MAG: hypothetical protein LBU07_01140 [Coriobacteriales bacterium]|nr:hypothetical protein [Coriobacteriales bacterium]